MEITPESPNEIIKGINDCFFELKSMYQHIKNESAKCSNVECELFKPRNLKNKIDN